jgi:hypothetical protein
MHIHRSAERTRTVGAWVSLCLAGLSVLFMLAPPGGADAAAPNPAPTATPVSVPPDGVTVALPDLVTLPPFGLRLVQNSTRSWRIVRFSNSIANIGSGPLEIVGRRQSGALGYEVRQRIFSSIGEIALEPLISAIEYHPSHGHWHLEAFARYELWSTTGDRTLFDVVRTSGKVSYCLLDSERQPTAPDARRGYAYCGPSRQGISAGWIDTYRSQVPGQWVDLAGLPPGIYALRSIVNPHHELREASYDNNEAIVYFQLDDNELKQIDASPAPWDRPVDAGPLGP